MRAQRRRRGAADAPLTSESVGGVFGIACGAWGALRGAGAHCWRGRRLFGVVGCPQGFYAGPCRSPGRSRTAARPVRGSIEACVSSRSAQPWVQLGMGSLAFWCALLAKRKPDNQPARRSVSQSHLSDPRIMQSMLLLFACSAVALLPAPARQHRARGVVRMGWGDPPVCEPRPRSGFCARCTPSTRRPPRRWRLRHRWLDTRAGLVRGDHQIEHRGLRGTPRD